MFYHASLLLDYEGFRCECAPLSRLADNGDYIAIAQRATDVMRSITCESFWLDRYGFASWDWRLPSVEEVMMSAHRNSEIGRWFLIVLSTWLTPSQSCVGYDWARLSDSLRQIGWHEKRVALLFYGYPTWSLIRSDTSNQHASTVAHADPYWKWIRPLYTHGQGGWLDTDACRSLSDDLLASEDALLYALPPQTHQSGSDQPSQWRRSVRRGYLRALAVLRSAVERQLGLYQLVLGEAPDNDSLDDL